MRVLAFVLLGLIIISAIPLSEEFYIDISSDGSHLLKIAHSETGLKVYVDGSSFNVSEFVYSIDGNGSHLFLLGVSMIYVYTYSGEFVDEIPLNGSDIYGLAYHNGFYFITQSGNYSLIIGPEGTLYNSSDNYVIDIDYGSYLVALVYESESYKSTDEYKGYVIYYDEGSRKSLGEVYNASYIAAFGDVVKVYDYNGNLLKTFAISKAALLPEPKPVTDLTPSEAVVASSGATAGYLTLLYYIRQRQLTSLVNLRRLLKRKTDYLLALPIIGRIIEEIATPYKDPLTLLVILAISIGGGYAIYSLIKREFQGKLRYLRIILAVYGLVFSFIGLIKITRWWSVIVFYALTIAYALIDRFYLKTQASIST